MPLRILTCSVLFLLRYWRSGIVRGPICSYPSKPKGMFYCPTVSFLLRSKWSAAVRKADENENGVPDQVEDVAKQIWVTHQVLVKTLGFPDPLANERYAEAKFVDVHFLSKATVNSGPTTQRVGTAYDGLQKFKRNGENDNTRSLCIDLSTVINADRNISPSHEYFHLIENRTRYFKTRWYTEGMARWSEHGLNNDRLGRIKYRGPWPQSPEDQKALFAIAYDAEFVFWNPLAKIDDPKGVMDPKLFGSAIRNQRYANGKRVLRRLRIFRC